MATKRAAETKNDEILVDLTYIIGEMCDMENWQLQQLREQLRESLRTRVSLDTRRKMDRRLRKAYNLNADLLDACLCMKLAASNGN